MSPKGKVGFPEESQNSLMTKREGRKDYVDSLSTFVRWTYPLDHKVSPGVRISSGVLRVLRVEMERWMAHESGCPRACG